MPDNNTAPTPSASEAVERENEKIRKEIAHLESERLLAEAAEGDAKRAKSLGQEQGRLKMELSYQRRLRDARLTQEEAPKDEDKSAKPSAPPFNNKADIADSGKVK